VCAPKGANRWRSCQPTAKWPADARLRSQGFEQSIFDQKGSIAGGKSKAGSNLAEPYFRGHHLVGQAMTGKKLAKKK
jgi:hypothetical protein